MSFNVLFANFSKRINSTKQPVEDAMVSMSVALKDGCSEHDPVFIVNRSNNSFTYNYCKWDDRYYWVTDVEYTRNQLFTVTCRLDVLATHKSAIMSTQAFIEYRDSGNEWIADTRLPVSPKCTISSVSASFSSYYNSVGTYLIQSTGAGNSTGVFAVSESYMSRIMNEAYEWVDGLFPDDVTSINIFEFYAIFFKQLLSAGDIPANIHSVNWIPFDVSSVTETVFPFRLGNYNTGFGSNKVSQEALVSTITLSIPWQETGWKRSYPYHRLKLYIPFIGSIDLGSEFCNKSSVTIKTSVSPVDGSFTVSVGTGSEIVGTYHGTTAVNIIAGTGAVNPAGAAINLLKGNIGGAAASLNSLIGTPSMVGNIGGGSAYGLSTNIVLTSEYYEPLGEETVHGAPYMSSGTPSSGYVQTRGFSLSASAHDDEINEVNSLMDGGVYLE